MVERCLGHTPTLEEAYSVKARILKHAGDPTGAAASADKARHMDLADRHALVHLPTLISAAPVSDSDQ